MIAIFMLYKSNSTGSSCKTTNERCVFLIGRLAIAALIAVGPRNKPYCNNYHNIQKKMKQSVLQTSSGL